VEKNKIQFWQLGMASFSYDIEYLPGEKNQSFQCAHANVLFRSSANLQLGDFAPGLVPSRRHATTSLCAIEELVFLNAER